MNRPRVASRSQHSSHQTPPQPALQAAPGDRDYNVATIDVLDAPQAELESDLYGIDAVVSALNGKALESPITIQDAAAAAVGVKRFSPGEYGFHHIYHKPDSDWGFVHPMWDLKAHLTQAEWDDLHGPAVRDAAEHSLSMPSLAASEPMDMCLELSAPMACRLA